MIDTGIVSAKLSQLRERHAVLAELAAEPWERFVQDRIKVSAAERQIAAFLASRESGA